MPYRTKSGSHYHETYGCHGATIACSTEGLEPCSDCCGGKQPGQTKGASATPVGGTGAPSREWDRTGSRAGRGFASAGDAGGSPDGDAGTGADARADGLASITPDDIMRMTEAGARLAGSTAPASTGPIDLGSVAGTGLIDATAGSEPPRPSVLTDATAREAVEAQGAAFAAGHASDTRYEASAYIAAEAEERPQGTEREVFRRAAQRAWNEAHLETPILEWSRADAGYVSDTETAVIVRERNYDEMRDFNGGSNDIGYDYHVMEKATGRCVDDEVRNADLPLRRVDREIEEIESDVRARANAEIASLQRDLFGDWLEGKRGESRAWRYHDGAIAHTADLFEEFARDTGYVRPEPQERPTDEERERLAGLYWRRREAIRTRDDVMMRYGIDDEALRLVKHGR